ncbi:MAG: hypothetical protein HND53_02085 [Proteobacteria bacterium]|nr:hypothetical protein [Pseudomonadota bacterium]
MKDKIKELSPSLFLLYAQLLEQVNSPTAATKDVSFKRIEVDGKFYWIRRVKIGSTTMDLSLGRETNELLDVIEQEKKLIEEAEKESKTREDLVAMLIAGGANTIDPLSGRVLTLLESAGVFAAGGVLVGSNAFNVYGNMFGYKFPIETAKTADIDLTISIGVTKEATDLKTAMMESGLGFLEVPALNRKSPSTSYKIRGSEIKVDLLTPLIGGPNTSKPIYMQSLKSYASPLRFLDYLIKDPISAIAVSGKGILVNIPQPARYAIHKLVLSSRRPITMQVKSIKDLNQAACLLEILSLDRPTELYPALIDVCKGKSRKFENQMLEGFQKICNDGLLTKETVSYFEENWEKAKKEKSV